MCRQSLVWSVNHIQQYYQRTDLEIQELYNRPYIYLSGAEADLFVEETGLRLAQVYEQLWNGAFTVDGAVSVLDLGLCYSRPGEKMAKFDILRNQNNGFFQDLILRIKLILRLMGDQPGQYIS